MATWVIGDVQGCFEPLQRLLAAIRFEPDRDRLWLVGDLVNRGPDSLGVLRWAAADASVSTVLGNHDLHLLARWAGVRPPGVRDTLDDLLGAPDCDNLMDWLRRRPLLLHRDGQLLVHAGLLPSWSIAQALDRAFEVETALRGPDYRAFLATLHEPLPSPQAAAEPGPARLHVSAAVLTRLRACTADGVPALAYTGAADGCPDGTAPWFTWPTDRPQATRILFGHWAALGARRGAGWAALDSGCVWGRALTAMRLADGATVSVPAAPPTAATPVVATTAATGAAP